MTDLFLVLLSVLRTIQPAQLSPKSYFCPLDNSASNGFISLSIAACLYSCLYTTFNAGSTTNTIHLLSSPSRAFVTAPSQSNRKGISFEVGSCPEIFFLIANFGASEG